jgi:predicted Zn-ribbon and HTH transcriptional regulator
MQLTNEAAERIKWALTHARSYVGMRRAVKLMGDQAAERETEIVEAIDESLQALAEAAPAVAAAPAACPRCGYAPVVPTASAAWPYVCRRCGGRLRAVTVTERTVRYGR